MLRKGERHDLQIVIIAQLVIHILRPLLADEFPDTVRFRSVVIIRPREMILIP